MSDTRSTVVAFGWIIIAYCAALAVAVLAIKASSLSAPYAVLLADIMATLTVFLFSFRFRNSSFYDAYWSVAPPIILGYWGWVHVDAFSLRLLAVSMLVLVWSVRLTGNWSSGWGGLQDADWRYVQLKTQLGRFYWPVSLLGVHLMPTLIVFAGCLPLYVVAGSAAGWQVWDSVGLLIGVAAICLEARADLELKSFQLARHSRDELLTTGVWAWCRHPNYLGEIGFWVALACFALGTGSTALWSLIGAAAMIVLFVGVSIPMIEKKLDAGKPGYAEYRTHTPMLLPLGRWTANRG